MANHVRPEVAVGAVRISVVAQAFGEVQNNRNRKHVILTRQAQQPPPVTLLNVGGVNDNQLAEREALGCNVVEKFKRFRRDGLIVFVVRN